jgi:CheY-like chemotaxis protein
MSHEIRTPLHGMLGLSELLSSSALNEQQRDYVKNIRGAGNSLLLLINDILDFSKIEAGEMSLEKLAFDPAKVVRDTLDLMQPSVQDKDVSLEISVVKPLPLQLLNDPTRLRQVLLNLVGNALKFTKRGKVTVELHADPDKLVFEVKDSGIGMSGAVIAGLFEPFRQADGSITRKFGGTGLGLVICKSLIEKMGGHLCVTSREGKGSCFSFALPLTEEMWLQAPQPDGDVAQDTRGEDNISAPANDPSGLHILLVDDQPINRLVALNQLRKLGLLTVDEAENGQKALEALQLKPYDVVLMDVQMPVMDGLDATRALRQLRLEPQPVVVAITANAFPEDRELCLQAGMNYFLPKPVAIAALKEALNKVLAGEINASTHGDQAVSKG